VLTAREETHAVPVVLQPNTSLLKTRLCALFGRCWGGEMRTKKNRWFCI